MSQVAAKKRLVLQDERVKVTARFREQGSVLRGDAAGFCEGFNIEMRLKSDELSAEIAQLVRIARQMCFTEVALTNPVDVTVNQWLNGEPLQV